MPRSLHALTTLAVSGLALMLGATLAPAYADEPPPTPVPTVLAADSPRVVVDESSLQLRTVFTRQTGEPVVGATVVYEQRVGSAWRTLGLRTTNATGLTTFTFRPRADLTWRARGISGAREDVAWAAAHSAVITVDNRPRRAPLRLGGPAPRALPVQARAVGSGPHLTVGRVPDAVWRSMVGRSWHRGCPVGRDGLRLLRVNYWGFDGYRYRGELVVNAAIARRAGAALAEMHARALPIRSMYRVDRFGWSRELQGADDRASMRADNTSAFNCRQVVGRPGVRSPHSTGRSVDLNPWENPYRTSAGWVPNTWWVSRSHPQVAWRSSDHAVVQLWRRHGFRWTYGTSDAHHYDGRVTSVAGGGFTG